MWDDIEEYIIPRYSNWDLSDQPNKKVGARTGSRIFDGTAQSAIQDFVDGYQGNTASPLIRWCGAHFRSKDAKNNYEGRKWMDGVMETMLSEWNNSNFYTTLYEATYQRSIYGPSHIMDPVYNIETNRMSFDIRHAREIYFASDTEGRPNLWHRKFLLTGRQILSEFPDAILPRNLQKAIEDNPYTEHVCIHAIYRREERDVTRIDNKNMPWASVYILSKEKVLLRESGFVESPITTSRWRMVPGETYPRSTAIDTLYECLSVNQMSRSVLRAAQLLVEPPYIVYGTLKGKLKITPAGQTTIENPSDSVKPLEFPANLMGGLQQIADVRSDLRERFKTKIFNLMSSLTKEMTATQAAAMQGEQAVLLGPIVTRDQYENLMPLIHKSFKCLRDAGKFDQPPESLRMFANTPVDIEFLGPVAMLARRYLQMQGINAGMSSILPIAKEFSPEVLDRINFDEYAKFSWEAAGAPAKVFRSDEEVAVIRQQRAAAQKQAQAAQAMQVMSDAYVKTNTPIAPNSGAEQIMGPQK